MASKSNKGEILAKFFDDGEYTALFADGAVSAACGYAAGQQAYAVYQVESGRRFQQRLWSSKTGKCRRIIPEDKLRRDRVHSDKGSTFSHFHGVRGTIEALREKHCLSRLCRLA